MGALDKRTLDETLGSDARFDSSGQIKAAGEPKFRRCIVVTNEIAIGPVFVRGLPAPFATAREKEWRQTVANHLNAAWGGRRHIRRPCEMRLLFRLPPEKAAVTDVDNLLKATIDGAGRAPFPPARTGHPVAWDTADHWIYRLIAEKGSEPDP